MSTQTIATASVVKDRKADFFDFSGWFAFLMLCIIYSSSTYVVQTFVMTEEVYYNTLGEQLTVERIQKLLSYNSAITWVQVVALPIIAFIQVVLISFCFNFGAIVMGLKVNFRQIFSIILKGYLVLALGKLLQALVCLLLPIETVNDFAKADLFSLNGLFANLNLNIPEILAYPLTLISLFELAFCWILILAFKHALPQRKSSAIQSYVIGTYGITMAFWVIIVMFLQLNMG